MPGIESVDFGEAFGEAGDEDVLLRRRRGEAFHLVDRFHGDEAGEADALFRAVLHESERLIDFGTTGTEAAQVVFGVAAGFERMEVRHQAGKADLDTAKLIERKAIVEEGFFGDHVFELVFQHVR